MTITHTDPALALICSLAADGHAPSHIAKAINAEGMRTNSGRGKWHARSVERMAAAAGIPIKYDPVKVRIAQMRRRRDAGQLSAL